MTSDDVAVVLSTDTTDPELGKAARHALERIGCSVLDIAVASRTDHQDPIDNDVVLAGLGAADLIVDVANLIQPSSHRTRLVRSTRVLAINVDAASDLDRLVAHPGLPRRVEHLDRLCADAASLSIIAATGDVRLTVALEANRRRLDRGVADRTGELARWPAGAVWVRPNSGGVNGTVVLMPGDIVLEARHLVATPVRVDIEHGHLVEIIGDSADADVIRSQLEAHSDADTAYQIHEIGFGLNLTRAAPSTGPFDVAKLAVGQGAAAAGRCSVRFGTDAAPSLTLTMAGASVVLDDRAVIEAGALSGAVAPDVYERAAAR